MDEVHATYGAPSRHSGPRARKEARKEARRGPPPNTSGRAQRAAPPESDSEDERAPPPPKAKGKRSASPEPEPPKKKPKSAKKAVGGDGNGDAEEPAREAKPKKKKEIVLPEMDDDVEDREIAWLEYMLSKEKAGEDDLSDGLDDILDFAGKLGPGGRLGKGDITDEDSDAGEGGLGSDFDISESEDDGGGGEDEEVNLEEDSEEEGESEGEEDGDSQSEDEGTGADEGGDDESDHDEVSNRSGPAEGAVVTAAGEPAAPEAPAPTGGRYIPPHLRAAALAERAAGDGAKAMERFKLERKVQGLLNRLSEANIDSILSEIEKLFTEHSRNDVTTIVTDLVIQMIGSKANLLDSFVVLYATLVGALHRVIGVEFGAHFLQTLVKKYGALAAGLPAASAAAAEQGEDEGGPAREAKNLLTLIAELYNSGVVGAALIYDLVRGFIGAANEMMPERSVEGLLKLLKCCGSQLRVDDPASLKDIVALVQERTRGRDKEMSTRARFMVETLVALQSGKRKAGLGAEREDVARMKKYLAGLGKKRRLLAPEPLRIGLDDLLAADTRGRWWIVGAGWAGNPLVEKAAEFAGAAKEGKKKAKKEREDEEVLLELARKQGMNTDVRRSVFVILTTSEDFQHACDRLAALRLTNVQEREFVRVALHCVGMEAGYNPYYTLVLQNLCAGSYDHRFTLQYAVWDMLRELGEGGAVPEHRVANVARALAFLMGRGSVDVTLLKAVDFAALPKASRRFLDTLLRALLLATQTRSPLLRLPRAFAAGDIDTEPVEETFTRALANAELAGGLAWALQGVRKNPAKDAGALEAEVIRQGADAALAVLARAV